MHLLTYLLFIAYPTITLCESPLPSTNLSPHTQEGCEWSNNDCKRLKTDPYFDTRCAEDGDGEVFSCFVECEKRRTRDRCESYCEKYQVHCKGKPSVTTAQDCKWTDEDCRNTNLTNKSHFDNNCAEDAGGIFSCFVACQERPKGDRCENYCERHKLHCNGKPSVTTTPPTATVGYTQAPAYRPQDCKWTSEDCRNTNWKTDPDFETNCAEGGDGDIFSCSVECEERPTGDRCENYCEKYKVHCNGKPSVTTTPPTATVGYTPAPNDCMWTYEDCRNTNLKIKSHFDINCAQDAEKVFSCFVECEERPKGDRCENNCKIFQKECQGRLHATTEIPKKRKHDFKCPDCKWWIVSTVVLGLILAIVCGWILYKNCKSQQVETDVANSPTVVYSRTASEETST